HCLLDGSAQHEAELKIQNAGSAELQMRLPASATECRLALDSGAEEPLDEIRADNVVTLPLPSDQRSVTLHVRYVSKGSLGIWPMGMIRAPVPRFDLPVLAQTWRVMLPPELAAASQGEELHVSAPGDEDRREALAAV